MKLVYGLGLAFALASSPVFAADKAPAKATTKAPAKKPAETTTASKSLYERLGGKGAIEAVVGEFLNNVTADARINSFFKTTNTANLTNQIG